MPSGRRPSLAHRLLAPGRRRAARKGERFVLEYRFPDYIWKRSRKRLPDLDDDGMALLEQGLREWFVCCAWRGRMVLGMPSRLVDEAWHEFILDSVSYVDFCERAFGGYLHHTPDEAPGRQTGDTLGETVRAWDRSGLGKERESILWDLGKRLGAPEPLGVSRPRLVGVRNKTSDAGAGWACAGWGGSAAASEGEGSSGGFWGSDGGSGGSDGGSGGGDGGGCGGGGCGGGGGGGS